MKKLPKVPVQSMIEPSLAKWVKQQAKRDGVGVSAWVRRLISDEQRRSAAVLAHAPKSTKKGAKIGKWK